MESSFSYRIDFTGAAIEQSSLIGEPGDFYREPLFSGGAIRFAAVQMGGAERLMNDFIRWLRASNRHTDPYQVARVADMSMAVETGILWLEHAAQTAERCFYSEQPNCIEEMKHVAAMTRVAVERACSEVVRLITAGVGAHGLLKPHTFEQTIRDLIMYLRQPAPDRILASIGHYKLDAR